MASVFATAALQIVVFLITTGFWWWGHFANSGERCGASCDWTQVTLANMLYLGVSGFAFAATAVAAIVSYRTGRDLMWIPVAGSALIVAGYFVATMLYDQAMAV